MSVEQMLQAADAFARTVAAEVAGDDAVGPHLRAEVDAAGMVSHVFEALQPGYRGWTWVVTVTAVDADAPPTVNDVVLLPGAEAIVAPAWTPYRDRIRPGDLGPGDVLPPEPDDLRLVPAWSAGDAETGADTSDGTDRLAAKELAGGRTWVLSLEGRDMAAQRWHDGEGGPHTAIAQQASGTCRTCGFSVGLRGPLADRFSVCANGMANDDGRVVDHEHGCGAHSGVRLGRATAVQALPDPYLDTLTNDAVTFPPPSPVAAEVAEPVTEAEPVAEIDTDAPAEAPADAPGEAEPVAEPVVEVEPVESEALPVEPEAALEPAAEPAVDVTDETPAE